MKRKGLSVAPLDRHDVIVSLRARGYSQRMIAKTVSLSPSTICRELASTVAPDSATVAPDSGPNDFVGVPDVTRDFYSPAEVAYLARAAAARKGRLERKRIERAERKDPATDGTPRGLERRRSEP